MKPAIFTIEGVDFEYAILGKPGEIVGIVKCDILGCDKPAMRTLPNLLNEEEALRQVRFLAEAHLRRHFPYPREATASSFSDWVYRYKNPDRIPLGIDGHSSAAWCARNEELAVLHSRALAQWKPEPGWEVLHRDGSPAREVLCASQLRFQGSALRCTPDLVLYHRASKLIRFLEFKVRTLAHRIPQSGYIDNQAQLWCYLRIDRWRGEKCEARLQFLPESGIDAARPPSDPFTLADHEWDREISRYWARFGGEPI